VKADNGDRHGNIVILYNVSGMDCSKVSKNNCLQGADLLQSNEKADVIKRGMA
jgi:hypothetical protein